MAKPPRHQQRSPIPQAGQARGFTADELNQAKNMYDSLMAASAEAKKSAAELRAAASEAHGVLRGLQAEVKKAERIVPMHVGKQIKDKVAEELKVLGDETQEAMELAVKRVYAQFDKLEKMILGEEGDGPSLMEMLDALEPILPVIQALVERKINVKNLNVRYSEDKSNVDTEIHVAAPWSSSVPVIPAGDDRFA